MRFQVFTADELAARPDPVWPIPAYIPPDFTVLVGPGAKAFVPFLGDCLADSLSFDGEPVPALPGAVVYISVTSNPGTGDGLPFASDDVWQLEGFFTAGAIDTLITAIEALQRPVRAIILDDLTAFAGSLILRHLSGQFRVVRALDRLRERFDCALIALHQLDRTGRRLAGHSELSYPPDAILHVEVTGPVATIRAIEMRDAECPPITIFDMGRPKYPAGTTTTPASISSVVIH